MTTDCAQEQRGDAGFTLIEALATLLLTGLLVSAMTSITGQWMGGWNRGAGRLERAEALAVTLDRLALDIQSAVVFPRIGERAAPTFLGAEDWLMFVHPPFDRGAPPGLEVVRFYVSKDRILMRARGAYDPSTPFEKTSTRDAVAVSRETLGLQFAYLDKEGRWSSEWREALPPASVRAILSSARDSGDAITSSFPIHANAPAICARALGFPACEALAAGQAGALPTDALSTRRPRATTSAPP